MHLLVGRWPILHRKKNVGVASNYIGAEIVTFISLYMKQLTMWFYIIL